jgi:hypothetical protein
MGVLVGDVNGNGGINAADIALTKSQAGMAVSSSTFREDVNANGTISATGAAIGSAIPGESRSVSARAAIPIVLDFFYASCQEGNSLAPNV